MVTPTYIEPYKEKLKELFKICAKNSSKKMNAAMMPNELRKLYPMSSLYLVKLKLKSTFHSRLSSQNLVVMIMK